MNKILVYALLIMTAVSCGGDSKEKGEKDDKTNPEKLTITYSEELAGLFALCDTTEWPYVIDTTLLDSVRTYDSLSGEQVLWLYAQLDTSELIESVEYEVKSFFEIDSLKQNVKYAEWAEKRDIGEMKYGNAYLLHTLHLNDTTDIITWSVTYGTYEACPYASGNLIFATIFYNGKVSSCVLVGEDMAAGDPPVGMSRLVTGTISNTGNISLQLKEISTDEGEEGEVREEMNKKYDWVIKKGLLRNAR